MSFIQISDQLGVDLSTVGGANLSEKIPRRAKLPYRLGSAAKRTEGKAYNMTLTNRSAGVRKRGAGSFWQSRLQTALNRRTKAMQMDMRKGVITDFQLRAKKYPGLFIEG